MPDVGREWRSRLADVPTKRDNEEERFARIDVLMEEYRVNHEDLELYIKTVRTETCESRDRTGQGIDGPRARMDTARRQFRKSKGQ
jgi:hypothetical protein